MLCSKGVIFLPTKLAWGSILFSRSIEKGNLLQFVGLRLEIQKYIINSYTEQLLSILFIVLQQWRDFVSLIEIILQKNFCQNSCFCPLKVDMSFCAMITEEGKAEKQNKRQYIPTLEFYKNETHLLFKGHCLYIPDFHLIIAPGFVKRKSQQGSKIYSKQQLHIIGIKYQKQYALKTSFSAIQISTPSTLFLYSNKV